MSHSFVAYIDEAGDEGFKPGSSQWFILSACIVKKSDAAKAFRDVDKVISEIEFIRNAPIHFARLNHDARLAVAYCLSKSMFTVSSICFDKHALQEAGHTLIGNRRLYFYAARLLLERLSWFTRREQAGAANKLPCQLVFSKCKKLSYEELAAYINRLEHHEFQDVQIDYDFLDLENFQVVGHNDSYGCRLADAVSSGIRFGLDLSQYGLCEPQYAYLYKTITYRHNGNYTSYGLKFMPAVPAIEPDKNNRYRWISLYQQ